MKMELETRRAAGALRIGAVASATGVTPDAVRFYERLGLIPPPPRTDGRFRLYPPDTVARVRFIRQAQALGLELREIRELLVSAGGRPRERCRQVRAVLARHLEDVDARVRELEAFRRVLSGALGDCDRALERREDPGCPVLDHLGREDG